MHTYRPNQITVEALVLKTGTIYSLPLFYNRLNETINHPRSSVSDIVKIIMEDQGLSARILKLANSPMFGGYSNVDSITKSVTIIGFQQLRDLALASSVLKVFKGVPDDLLTMASFWIHSISCGIIARTLASYLRENNIERFFVAGVLHDVGQIVMCSTVPELVKEIRKKSIALDRLCYKTEYEMLGFNHAGVGGALLQHWRIPSSISEPVSHHHSPGFAKQFPLEAAVVHISDIICHSTGFGGSIEHAVPEIDDDAWKRLNMPVAMLSNIIKQAEPVIAETVSILTESL